MASHKMVQFQFQRNDGSSLSEHMIVDYKNYFREICEQYFIRHPVQIGGLGHNVQIDEKFVTKRKYNQGRLVNEAIMIFGRMEEENQDIFLCPVEKGDAENLHNLIRRCIFPDITVKSDCLDSYITWNGNSLIERLPEAYQHLTLNYSINFVDPSTGTNTQPIELIWQK